MRRGGCKSGSETGEGFCCVRGAAVLVALFGGEVGMNSWACEVEGSVGRIGRAARCCLGGRGEKASCVRSGTSCGLGRVIGRMLLTCW